ncbi:MAG: right-handed parallel beta-helix repeat-containing protein [Bacteroidota bacterium]
MATTYYVSPSGSDLADGLGPGTAWQSLHQVNNHPIQAGDSILLEGGQSFSGNLVFQSPRSGTAQQPLYIGRYGSGKASILAGSLSGIYVENGAGIHLENLIIIGDGRAQNDQAGILFYTDQLLSERLGNFQLRNLAVSGFNKGGIFFYAEPSTTELGFSDILIEGCEVSDNGDHGIKIEGKVRTQGYAHANVMIRNCLAHHNPGQIGKGNAHTGNGIVVGNSDTVLIERCIAHHNGAENSFQGGGPVGIWAWDSRKAVIQHCESHHNQTGSSKDGGGFDLDGGAVESVLQYNYSHDNEGAGYLMAEYDGARPLQHCVIRYNISENDGRKNSYAGIMLWRGLGVLSDIDIYHNTIFVAPAATGNPRAFWSLSNGLERIRVMNNLFVTTGNVRLIHKSHGSGADIDFIGNGYHNPTQVSIREGTTTYTDLTGWRAARNQEIFDGQPTGLLGDPLLNHPGNGGTLNDVDLLPTLLAYQIGEQSPALQAGIDLVGDLNLDPGQQDFFGLSLPPQGPLTMGAGAATLPALSLEPWLIEEPDSSSKEQWFWSLSENQQVLLQHLHPKTANWQIEVLDVLGKRIWQTNHPTQAEQATSLPLPDLAPGPYWVRHSDGRSSQWLRIQAP